MSLLEHFRNKHGIRHKEVNDYVDSVLRLNKSQKTFVSFSRSVLNLFKHRMPMNEHELLGPMFTYLKDVESSPFADVCSERYTPDNKKRRDLVVERWDDTMIIMELKFNDESAWMALNQIVANDSQLASLLSQIKGNRSIILVGLHLSSQKICNVCYLVNDLDMKKATSMTSYLL